MPKAKGTGAPESAVNSQIEDAVSRVRELTAGSGEELAKAAATQVMTQAVALAMQDAVAQQQQRYILRNTITAAAARALLDGEARSAEHLEALTKAVRSLQEALDPGDLVETLAKLKALAEELAGT